MTRPLVICMGFGLLAASAGVVGAQEVRRDKLEARMIAWTRLSKRAIVAVKPDVMVAILRAGVRAKTGDPVEGVVLQSEAADEGAAQSLGWRSMRSEVDISCAARGNRFRKVTRYSGHNLTGAPQAHTPPTGWIHPTAKAYMFDVIAAVCGPETPGSAPTIAVPMTAAASATIASASRARHPATLVGADLPEADTPMPSPGPAPASSPPPPTLPPATPPVTARSGPPLAADPRAGNSVVQIAAFPTAAESERALSVFAQTGPGRTAGVSRRIEAARVRGVVYYRAILTGFGSKGAALTFCALIKRGGGDCFVRP